MMFSNFLKVITDPSVTIYPEPLREPKMVYERWKSAVSALMLTDAEGLIK